MEESEVRTIFVISFQLQYTNCKYQRGISAVAVKVPASLQCLMATRLRSIQETIRPRDKLDEQANNIAVPQLLGLRDGAWSMKWRT